MWPRGQPEPTVRWFELPLLRNDLPASRPTTAIIPIDSVLPIQAMRLLRAQSDAVHPDDVTGRSPQHRHGHFKRNHVDVIAGKTVATALERCRIWVVRQNRSDEPVEAHDVKVEWIIGQSSKERRAAHRIGRDNKRIRCRV